MVNKIEPELKPLLPCAHCNGIASAIAGYVGYFCLCEGCGMQTPVMIHEQDAIDIWNNRYDK